MNKIVNPNNVRMRQFKAALCLAFKLIQHRTISNHQVRKKFQRDIALQFFVAREPNNPHSASAKYLHQRIATKHDLAAGSVERRLEEGNQGSLPQRASAPISVPHFWQTLITGVVHGSRSLRSLFYWAKFYREDTPDDT